MKKTGDIQYILFCVTILAVFLLASCAEEDKVEPTYSSLWDNVFSSCGVSCHNGSASVTDGTNLGPDFSTRTSFYDGVYDITTSSYGNWVNSADYNLGCEAYKIVHVGNANLSTLAAALVQSVSEGLADNTCDTGYAFHAANNSVITDSDTAAALTKWINDGAKND